MMKTCKALLIAIFMLLGANVALACGDVSAGEAKAANCAGCHGAKGEGAGDNPPLAGLDKAYHVEQLKAYKSGERENAMMQMFASQLSEEDMADIAAYYASLACE
jgi:cytochrome c553